MKEEEVWKDCPGFEDHYEVSNYGNLRSKSVFIPHNGNWNKDMAGYIKPVKIHRSYLNRYGYLHAKLCKYGKCWHRTIHRLVATAFIPNPNNLPQVNHIDGDKRNNHVSNLEWCSRSENIKHAYETGLMSSDHMKGAKHHNSKLTEEDVIAIRNSNATAKELAKQYGIGYTTVLDILKRRTWKHLDNDNK